MPTLIRSESAARHSLTPHPLDHHIDHLSNITFSGVAMSCVSSRRAPKLVGAEVKQSGDQGGCSLLALEPAERSPDMRVSASMQRSSRPNPLGRPGFIRWDGAQEVRPPAAGLHRHTILWRSGTRKDAASHRHHACTALASNTCCNSSSPFQPPIQRYAERPAHVSARFCQPAIANARGSSSLAGEPAHVGARLCGACGCSSAWPTMIPSHSSLSPTRRS